MYIHIPPVLYVYSHISPRVVALKLEERAIYYRLLLQRAVPPWGMRGGGGA